MAGLQERGGSYRIFFRFRGKQMTFPLGKVSKQEAEAKSAQVDYLLLRLKQRLIELPPGVELSQANLDVETEEAVRRVEHEG